ncbi:NAD-dependent epimerase/dehydratase family protein [Aphanothece minutissima]|uniref:NAD-dependent epimerase/dehydratase domain-containing protein n=1 Tax=Aphanothece cf. minutissima CCALA 015 TaxID=2107695 RepID=A0ABX5F577_9CHRO|nr:NAD-dependent epimerase/dehydratase family protein [Aphanothece minutissima]PSB36505.1 hypothetical protein C7B81_13080 [Aphanothece cf. minutissima CCALA 015]
MTSTSPPLIHPSDRIFVAGHRGMAGSASCRALPRHGYINLLTAGREALDLEDPLAVRAWFEAQRPEVVVLAAAKVGGIHANDTYPADFLLRNLKIQNNVIENAWRIGARRLLFLGSGCIYPKLAERPIREATEADSASVSCWGTGVPLREFLLVHDLGEACVFDLEHWTPDAPGAPLGSDREPLDFLNAGTGFDLSIRELTEVLTATEAEFREPLSRQLVRLYPPACV